MLEVKGRRRCFTKMPWLYECGYFWKMIGVIGLDFGISRTTLGNKRYSC